MLGRAALFCRTPLRFILKITVPSWNLDFLIHSGPTIWSMLIRFKWLFFINN